MLRSCRGRVLGIVVWVACAVAVARAADDTAADTTTTTSEQMTEEGDGKPDPGGDSSDQAPPASKNETRLEELVVESRKPMSAASAQDIRAHDFDVRPHQTIMQILNNLPGVVVAQHQGGSKAPQWFLRGFDADHGTDVAVSVDDMPINFPTHAHGQGYADPNFLIPEVIDRVGLYKGPYFTQFGDFATAGAINFVTKDVFAENFFLAEGGSFDTMRYVVGASPQVGQVKTMIAAQAYYTNGPFEHPENLARYNGYAKMSFDPTPLSHMWLTTMGYQADWDGSGQVPLSLVSAGKLDRFGSLDPTEGGHTDREIMDLHWRYTPTAADTWEVQTYANRYKLRLYSDFTFFNSTGLRFVQLPNGAVVDTRAKPVRAGAHYIPGDGIAQDDSRFYYGAKARFTRNWFLAGIPLQSQLAFETRNDDVDVALHRQVRRTIFYDINKVYVREHSFSGYWNQQIFFNDWVRFDGGLRGDFFIFDVNNRLPQQGTDPNFSPVYLDGYQTQGQVSPKANLIITPVRDTEIYLNFGEGFHSNDARAAIGGAAFTGVTNPGEGVGEDQTVTPLARAIGYEFGARTRQFDSLDLAASLWLLDLDSELVFSGDAGTDEPSPSSRRWGIDFETRYQITRWLFADYDLSYADPRFDNGGAIPLAPTLLMNGGLTAEFGNGLSVGLRARYLDDRPANEQRTLVARGYFLLDLIARYRWRNVELSLQLLNLTDTDWREAQFADTSCVRGQEQSTNPNAPCFSKPGKTGIDPPEGIHFTPGNPFNVRAGLKIFF